MSNRRYVSHLSATQERAGSWKFSMGLYLNEQGDEARTFTYTDLNLSEIMSAASAMFKQLTANPAPTTYCRGPIELTHWSIEDLTIAPYRWHMLMRTDRFSYAVNMDQDLEHVLLAFQGALKFFSFKYGLTTLDEDTVRNRDRAGEAGLLTQEDFHDAS